MNYHNPTLRVLNILEALASNSNGLTLTEISEAINSPKSTIFPIIQTMVDRKFIFFNKNSYTYTIGINTFCIGASYTNNMNALTFIKSEMEYIVKKTDEICQLGILEGGDVLYIAKVDSNNPIRILSSVGKKIPAYCTALGKSLISNLNLTEITLLYPNGLKAFTKNTITDFNTLYNELIEVKNTSIATEHGEINPDLNCVSVPLKNGNLIVASISITFPTFRLSEEKLCTIKGALIDAKSKIELFFKENNINDSQLILV